ncbi:PREDICTED: uncharacterized protein LOC109234897 [Nicotiana attenuata]|uniref:uncharacterized protein LOC109234897 n=1 Tax=Nicotiana attenuata TaxID=49451 RepID=UPI0009047A36|nr:PREDICTED: uncharacterized protein LOC109234897 [Nicotiana attenuata]
MGEAKEWLQKDLANSIHNWDDLARKFLIRFFPTKKTKSLRSYILGFQQRDGETLRQAWERYKKLLRDCPHHCQTDEVLGHIFVDGLDEASKMNLDSACGGSCMARPYREIQILLNSFTANDNNWQGDGKPRRALKQNTAGVIELDDLPALRADIARLANQMNKMTIHQAQQMQHVQQMSTCCELYGEGRTSDICPVNPKSIYYVGQQSRGPMNQHARYGNTYNPNWRYHPNFSWGGNQNIRPQANYNHPSQSPQRAEKNLTDMMKKLLIDNQKVMAKNQQVRAENQQLRTDDTEPNPKAQVNAVTLRNGRELEEIPGKKKKKYTTGPKEELVPKVVEENKKEKPEIVTRPPPPFPQRLQKQNDDAMYKKFLDILSQADEEVPIILGRPFLATSGALIDVREGKLKMRVEQKGIEQSPDVNCSDSDGTTELEDVVLQVECVRIIEKRARDERGDLLKACKKARLNGVKKKRKRPS